MLAHSGDYTNLHAAGCSGLGEAEQCGGSEGCCKQRQRNVYGVNCLMINWPGITSLACVSPLCSPALRATSRLWEMTSHQSVTVVLSPGIFEVTIMRKAKDNTSSATHSPLVSKSFSCPVNAPTCMF